MANDFTLSAKITADASQFDKAVKHAQKSLASLANSTKGLGKGFTQIGESVADVGKDLTKYITKPALAATTALGAITIGKGFKRLVQIDDAKVKLEALGHSAEDVNVIMKNALNSVKKTAFGLDEAATVAASAVAAGVKPGKDLQKYLTLTASAAAIAGTNMDEMGAVFNRIATKGKAQGRDLKQIAERGIPIYQWLAEEVGVSTEKIFEMQKAGEISTDLFLRAVEKNIGGAAKIMGEKSFSGAIKNIGASISRIGQGFLDGAGQGTGFFSQLKPLLVDFHNWLGSLEDKAQVLGESVGKAIQPWIKKIQELRLIAAGVEITPDISKMLDEGKTLTEVTKEITKNNEGLYGTYDQLNGRIQESTNGLILNAAKWGLLAASIGPVMQLTGGIAKGFGGVLKVFGSLTGKLPAVGGGFLSLFKGMGGVGKSIWGIVKALASLPGVTPLLTLLGQGFGLVASVIGGVFSTAWGLIVNIFSLLTPLLTPILNFFSMLGGFLAPIGNAILGLAGAFGSFLGSLATFAPLFLQAFNLAAFAGIFLVGLGFLYSTFQEQIDGFLNLAATKGPEIVTNLANGVSSKISEWSAKGAELIGRFLEVLTINMPSIVSGGVQILTSLVDGIANALPTLLPAAMKAIITFVQGIIQNLPQIIQSGANLLSKLVQGIVGAVGLLISSAPQLIGQFVSGIIHSLPAVISAGGEILLSLAEGILRFIWHLPQVAWQLIQSIWGAITNFDWGSLGGNIIRGIVNGIGRLGHLIKDKLMGLAKSAWQGVKNFLHIGSPSKLFEKTIGYQIPAGEAIGIEKGGHLVTDAILANQKDSLAAIQSTASLFAEPSMEIGTPTIPTTGGVVGTYRLEGLNAGGFDGTVNVNNVVEVDGTPLYIKATRKTIDTVNTSEKTAQRAMGGVAYGF